MKNLLFTLIFGSALYAQPSFTSLEDIAVYDENNDGFAQFDLTANSSELLDGLEAKEHIISYHLTFKDADVNRNSLPKPTAFTNSVSHSQELYARVTNIADPSNYSVDLFTIRTNSSYGSSQESASKTIKPVTE